MGPRKQKLKWGFWSYRACLLAGNKGNIAGGWAGTSSLSVCCHEMTLKTCIAGEPG